LEIYLQEDTGTNWAAWQALCNWLKETALPTTAGR